MDNQNNLQLVQDITKTILDSVRKALDNAKFDRSFKAKVVLKESNKNNSYTVLYNGMYYSAISAYECAIGDIVRVCAPRNNWNELFIVANIGHDGGHDEDPTTGQLIEIGRSPSRTKNVLLFDTDNN